MSLGGKYWPAIVLSLALIGGACGGGDEDEPTGGTEQPATDEAVAQNACPTEGCTIGFGTLAKSGDEIEVTWDINFAPDINNNHVHIYWDNFSAAQVSNDATDRGVEQGDWVPTAMMPTYVTDGPASTSVRGDSTTLCLVAADRDHNVIDEATEVCQDVSEYL